MSSQNNIVMNIETMFKGLKGDSRQKLDGVAKLFAKTFDRFAKPFGINIDKNSIKTVEDLEKKFRELGVTATQVGNQISLSMKAADGKFVSTSFQYEGGVAGKGKARLTQGATIQTASYLKPTEQLRRNYENVIKARKELDALEQKGFSKTSATWQQAEQSVKEYNTQLYDTIEALKQRYNLTVDIDRDKDKIVWGNGKGQLETMGRKYQYGIKYSKTKAQDTAAIQAEAKAHQENTQKVREYVSALQTQYREEEKLVRLQQAKAPKQVIQAQQEVVTEAKRQTQALFNQVKGTEELNKVKDKLILSDKKHKQTLAELTNTTQKSVSIFGKFKETLKQVVSAGLSWKIFSAITQTVKKTIDTVKELDKSLVDLQIATGSTRAQAEELLHTYNQMAKELGATTQEVAGAADSWLRQGYSTAQTNELIRSSMVLSKIGQIESAEATQYLTSALKGFDIEAEKSIEIVDKLAAIDLISATNASGLAEALSRTAASANLAGVEMEQLLGYVAVVGETTQKSMSTIGESFKTIFARFGNIKAGKFVDDETGEDLNDVAKILSQFNIQLYDAQGNMADVGKILDELAKQWGNLETVEKNALASAIAGVRQRENFIVLMDNYGDAIKYTEEALNSSGTAMEKYDAYLQSIEASQAKLKANFEEFSQLLVDKGIIKGFYDLATVGVKVLNMVVRLIPVLQILAVLLIGKLSGKFFANLTMSIYKLTLKLKQSRTMFSQSITNIKAYITALKSTGTQLMTTAQAAQVAAGKLALVQAAMTVVTAAITIAISVYQYHQQQIEENIESAKEHIKTVQEEQKTLADLKQQYIDLSKSENYNDETRKSIQSIQEQINKLVGEEADGIDLVNGKLDDQLKKLDEISIKTAQGNLEELYGEFSTLRQNLGKNFFSYTEGYSIAGLIEGEAAALITAMHSIENYTKRFPNVISTMYYSNSNMSLEEAQALLEEYIELRNEIDPDVENLAWNAANGAIKELTKRIDDYNNALNNYNNTQAIAIIGADLFNNKIKIDSKEAYDSYIESLRNAKDENGNLLYSEEAIQAMIKVLSEKFPQFADKIEDTSNVTNALSHDLKTLKDTYETLNSAIDEYNSNGSISYDTWEKLLDIEDQYLAALVDENGQIKSNNQALQDLIKTKIEDATLTKIENYVSTLETAAKNNTLQQTLLLTKATIVNTNARLANVMATIASIDATEAEKKQIMATIAAMLKMSSAISIGNDSTSDAKKATEDWEKVLDYANTILDEQIEKLEKEQEALEKLTEEKIKAHEAEIKRLEEEKEALEEKNEEKNKELELEELERNLQKAKQRTMRVYHEGKGWVWEQDPEALQKAQQELDDFHTEQQIENIEDLIEAEEEKIEELENNLDKEIESYKERIKAIKDYKEEWNKVKEEHEKAQNEIIAKAKLGADAEKEILMGADGRLKVLDDFKEGYTKALGEVAKKTEESVSSINTSLGKFDFEALMELLNGSGKTEDWGKFGNYKFVKGEEDENGVSIKYVLDKDSGRYYKEADLAEWRGEYYYTKGTSYFGKAYASGTLSAKSGLATVDEKGNELIVPKQGRYRMMEYGDTVVPHNLSQRLFEVASNPLRFIANALNSVKTPNLMSNSNQVSNSSIIHIGTIELPSVTNGENFVRQLQLIAANR